MRCMQEVRWRGQGARMVEMKGIRQAVVVWIRRWSRWCGSYDKGGAV